MQREGLDWIHTFPRLHVFRFAREETAPAAPQEYSPSDSFAREQERAADEAEHARLQSELDAAEQKARAEARNSPAPPVAQAYRAVYGRWPDGWPP